MALSPVDRMTKARINLVISAQFVFFGTLALRLKLVEDPKVQACASDGTCLRFNPEFAATADMSEIQGAIAATVLHLALLHHTRRGAREQKKWEQAADYAVDPIVLGAGLHLPGGGKINPAYNGMMAEHIYTLLPDNPDDKNGQGQGQGQGQGGGQNPGQGNDPSGCEDSPNSQNGGGSGSQEQQEEAEWKTAMAQAMHQAKQAGKMPSELERLLEQVFEPVLPWKDILRRFMTERAPDDYSWNKGNRRFLAQGLYLPSRDDIATGEIVVGVDTSGSIGEKELQEFGNEINGIVKELRPSRTTVIYCDAAVNKVVHFSPDDDVVLEAVGGGGTDFRPPFKWVEKQGLVPKCFVYLTDGYGPFPEEQDYPVLWAITNRDVTPPNGEHLILEV